MKILQDVQIIYSKIKGRMKFSFEFISFELFSLEERIHLFKFYI